MEGEPGVLGLNAVYCDRCGDRLTSDHECEADRLGSLLGVPPLPDPPADDDPDDLADPHPPD